MTTAPGPTRLTLGEIADLTDGRLVAGSDPEQAVTAVVSAGDHDQPGSVFVAYRGRRADGHDFVAQAFAHGAVAAVVEDPCRLDGQPGVVVADARAALSRLAAAFAGEPSRELVTVGVTGTNGKTTIHWLVAHALDHLGWPAVRIGSLGIAAATGLTRSGKVTTRDAGQIHMTTPAAEEIHRTLALARAEGCRAAVVETSSHALDQRRVADVWFDVAVFSNLSADHLDYHPDLESYFQAKADLFRQLARQRRQRPGRPGGAVVGVDDDWGRRLAEISQQLELPVLTVGWSDDADLAVAAFDQRFDGSELQLRGAGGALEIRTPLIGDFNAANLAAAAGALLSLGLDREAVARALAAAPAVPGRLEPVGTDEIAVLVDYAHTAEGLHSALAAVRGFVRNELWVVFGCGGGKDPRRREGMGRVAAELADRIVLTSDNPKHENPRAIVDDILRSGCRAELVELDRRRAIEQALAAAAPGDVVVLAGKGHEDYQILGGETHHHSDREVALACRARGVLAR